MEMHKGGALLYCLFTPLNVCSCVTSVFWSVQTYPHGRSSGRVYKCILGPAFLAVPPGSALRNGVLQRGGAV